MRKTTAYARQRGLHRVPPDLRQSVIDSKKSNGLLTNNERNTPFTESEVQYLLADPKAAQESMRTGRGTYNNFLSLTSALNKGNAIEDRPNIIRGFAPIYSAASAALLAIEARATRTGRWVPTALYAAELGAIDDLLFAYEHALRVCTYAEFYACQAKAIARVASAGQPVFKVGDVVEYLAP